MYRCCLQCYDTVGWVTGRISSLVKTICVTYPQRFSSRTSEGIKLRETGEPTFICKIVINMEVGSDYIMIADHLSSAKTKVLDNNISGLDQRTCARPDKCKR